MAVACGFDFTVAIGEHGQFCASGRNDFGQLGLHLIDDRTTINPVPGLPAAVRQVAAGSHHTGIVTDAGDLLMCGRGMYGQLGLGDREDRRTPTLMPRAVFDGEAVLMVACGHDHTAAVTEGGRLYTWGHNFDGELGHGDTGDRLRPTLVGGSTGLAFNGERIVMVAVGDAHTVALTEAGHVFTWGAGHIGQLGHNDFENQPAPEQVEVGRFGNDAPERVVFVAAGGHTTAAVTVGGKLYTWGRGYLGQLGLGYGTTRFKRVPTLVPRTIFAGEAVLMAACSHRHTLVVTQEGNLWACGYGHDGVLGLNDHADRFCFERVGGATGAKFGGARVVVAAANFKHSAAVTEDGALWIWGLGHFGRLGNGDYERNWLGRNNWLVPKKISQEIFRSACSQVPPAHMLAFTMGAQNRLGASSPIRIIGGEQGLFSMIAQFTHKFLPPAVKKSEGLMRLLGLANQQYQMTTTATPS